MNVPDKFTVEQWIEELRLASSPLAASEGESVREITARTGLPRGAVFELLQAAAKLNRLKVSKRQGIGIDGRKTNTPVYLILPAMKRKK